MRHDSGQATSDGRSAGKEFCYILSGQGLVVKYKCANGKKRQNQAHEEFFNAQYPLCERRVSSGLQLRLAHAECPSQRFPSSLEKLCNKMKNYPIVLSSDFIVNAMTCEELQTLLRLRKILTDKSLLAKMRDSYAVKLFSFTNCSTCIDSENMMSLMYLLLWALQEEVMRNPFLSRGERLEKAILSFTLLLH
jgi:hypothetical protein